MELFFYILQTFKSFYFNQGSTKCGPSITWHRNENFAEFWRKIIRKNCFEIKKITFLNKGNIDKMY